MVLKTMSGVTHSGGNCPIICACGLADLRRHITQLRVMDLIVLRPRMIWKRRDSEEERSDGPACRRRLCS